MPATPKCPICKHPMRLVEILDPSDSHIIALEWKCVDHGYLEDMQADKARKEYEDYLSGKEPDPRD